MIHHDIYIIIADIDTRLYIFLQCFFLAMHFRERLFFCQTFESTKTSGKLTSRQGLLLKPTILVAIGCLKLLEGSWVDFWGRLLRLQFLEVR